MTADAFWIIPAAVAAICAVLVYLDHMAYLRELRRLEIARAELIRAVATAVLEWLERRR